MSCPRCKGEFDESYDPRYSICSKCLDELGTCKLCQRVLSSCENDFYGDDICDECDNAMLNRDDERYDTPYD